MNKTVIENEQKKWLKQTWEDYPPEWFITFHWNTLPRRIETVESYVEEFKLWFRRKFHWKIVKRQTRGSSVPFFPQGVGMQFFHERSEMYHKDKLITPFHTHLHLSNTRGYFRDEDQVKFFILELIRHKKVKNLRKLKPELVVKRWNDDHHANYNVDCRKKKRDEYIVGKPDLDIFSSDLLNTHF